MSELDEEFPLRISNLLPFVSCFATQAISYLHAVVKVDLVTRRRPHPRDSIWVAAINQRPLYKLVVKKVLVRHKVGRSSVHVAAGAIDRFRFLACFIAYVGVDRDDVGPLQRA